MTDFIQSDALPEAATVTEKLVSEGLIGLSPAARLFGTTRNGRARHASTLTRYIHDGVRLTSGRIVRLEAIRSGSQLMTSKAAVLRFLAAQQDDPPASSLVRTETPSHRRRAAEAASSELDAVLGSSN